MSPVDPDALCGALRLARKQIASALQTEMTQLYDSLAPPADAPFDISPATVGRRRLRNVALRYLAKLEGEAAEERREAQSCLGLQSASHKSRVTGCKLPATSCQSTPVASCRSAASLSTPPPLA